MDVSEPYNIHRSTLRLLSDLWKIPIAQHLIAKANPKFKTKIPTPKDCYLNSWDFRHLKDLIEGLQANTASHRRSSRPADFQTFKKRMGGKTSEGISRLVRDFHKDFSAHIIFIRHTSEPILQVYSRTCVQFLVPRSWFKHCLNITRTHLSDSDYMLARARPIGKSSDGHPMFLVKIYKATYKPKSTGLELVLQDETFLTHDADGTDFALGLNFMQARDKLRKQMAKSMTVKMKTW